MGYTFLVAEDKPALIGFYKDVLRLEFPRSTVHAAADVREAISELESLAGEGKAPNVIITDNRMPNEGDGFTLLGYVLEKHPRIPVIMASSDDIRRQALDGGAVGFVSKPLSAGDLVEAVKSALKNPKYQPKNEG